MNRLLICTPCYDRPIMPWVESIDRARRELAGQVEIETLPACEHSLIADARNKLLGMFMQESTAEAMLFIDADESFTPRDVMAIVRGIDHGWPIVGAAYAKKLVNWEAIHAAVLAGATPWDLQRIGSTKHNFSVSAKPGDVVRIKRLPNLWGPYDYVEVEFCGTGFLGIARAAVQRLRVQVNKDYAVPGLDEPLAVPGLFEDYVERAGYVGEDIHFCRLARRYELPIHVFLDSQVQHWGMYAHPANARGAMEAAGYRFKVETEVQERG